MKKEKKGRIATFLAGLLTGGIGTYVGLLGLAQIGVEVYGISNATQLIRAITLNPAPFLNGLGGIAAGGVCLGIAGKTIARNIRTIAKENKEKAAETFLSKKDKKEIFKERIKEEPNKSVIQQAKKNETNEQIR